MGARKPSGRNSPPTEAAGATGRGRWDRQLGGCPGTLPAPGDSTQGSQMPLTPDAWMHSLPCLGLCDSFSHSRCSSWPRAPRAVAAPGQGPPSPQLCARMQGAARGLSGAPTTVGSLLHTPPLWASGLLPAVWGSGRRAWGWLEPCFCSRLLRVPAAPPAPCDWNGLAGLAFGQPREGSRHHSGRCRARCRCVGWFIFQCWCR